MTDTVSFRLNEQPVSIASGGSLLDALREQLGVRSVKDGCSPQGQCGCCTVWVDDQPRVACVTPVARVAGRAVTTVEGLADAAGWAQAFCDGGATQCGFCTPGIVMRLAALDPVRRQDPDVVRRALLANLCRCTGWQTIVEVAVGGPVPPSVSGWARHLATSERCAEIEGGVPQRVAPDVALGAGGFADDLAPADALVALRAADGNWVVGETLAEARVLSGKVQGRRTTAPLRWPIEVPDGGWVRTLRTTWVEPAYLEPDASWCAPGAEPFSSHGNGGAFGAKQSGELGRVARRLADEHGRPVRVLATREDVVRFGAKRPPLAAGVRADGTGVVHVARTPGVAQAIRAVAPGFEVLELDVVGPPTSASVRAAGWAEAAVLLASLQPGPTYTVRSPAGATASASIAGGGTVRVRVDPGTVLDPVVLRSYCIGAAHMALGWVRSEAISVDRAGEPHDLTIRSFGVLRAVDTPQIDVELVGSQREPVNASDAVFAAVATAAWAADGFAERWPTRRGADTVTTV
jgi:aerobic-type carbon monoxide dehydrogenase small subunit (CoxS/CutS family)